jgi:hypothetical protein
MRVLLVKRALAVVIIQQNSKPDGDHRLKDDAANLMAAGQVLALPQVDSNEWNGLIPIRTRGSVKAERHFRFN